jgi:GT2 family glycosyltransferase
MDKVSVMMCTYNRLDLTKRMLGDYIQKVKKPHKLIIVDDFSTDGTREFFADGSVFEWLKKNPVIQDVLYYKNPENKGVAKSRNRALRLAVTEHDPDFYCTVDNDVELPEGWLTECVDILKANRNFGAIGANFEKTPFPLVTKKGYTFQEKPRGNLGTACMVFPRSIQKMMGYFNEEYGKYGEEDADFGMRVRVAGFKLGYIERMGNHFGDGELDQGEYREFKTTQHTNNLPRFNANCAAYAQRKKGLYIPFKD